MAVAIENPETLSDGDGVTSAFPTVWTFEDAAEVQVTVRDAEGVWSAPKVEGVDYELTGADWLLNGATVAFLPGKIPGVGTQVLRRRVTPTAQAVPFGDQASFRPGASEDAYDRLTRQMQERAAAEARAVAVPPGEPGLELAAAADRASRTVLFDAEGGLGLHTAPNTVIANDASGRAVTVPIINLLQEAGVDLIDDGSWAESSNPLDDGGWG